MTLFAGATGMQYTLAQAGKPSPNASSLPHVLRLVYNVLAKSQGPLSEQDVSSQLGGDRRAAFSPANVLITLRQLKDLNYVVEFSAPDTKAPAPGTAKGDQNVAGGAARIGPVLATEEEVTRISATAVTSLALDNAQMGSRDIDEAGSVTQAATSDDPCGDAILEYLASRPGECVSRADIVANCISTCENAARIGDVLGRLVEDQKICPDWARDCFKAGPCPAEGSG